MASHSEMKIEKIEQEAPEGELDADPIGSTRLEFVMFTNFYDQMDFDAGKRLAIIKTIVEVTDCSGG